MNTKSNFDIETEIRLNRAIEKGDVEEITELVDSLPSAVSEISPDDFIKKIKYGTLKEENTMKKKLSFKAVVIAAAAAAITCVSVGAAVQVYKTHTYGIDGSFMSVSSKTALSDEDAKALAEEALKDFEEAKKNGTAVTNDDIQTFDSVEEAERAAEFSAVLPGIMPDLAFEKVSIQKIYHTQDDLATTMWLEYGNIEDRAIDITITKNDFADEDYINVSRGDGYATGEKYVSEKGYSFDVLLDTNEEKGIVASTYVTNVGAYEYAVVTLGFDDSEVKEIIDSVDLSAYSQE